MSPDWIIGALALFTIGGVLGLSIFHFGFHLRDPKNLEAVKRVAEDRESATTRAAAAGTSGRSLRQRLDEAPKLHDRLSNRQTSSIGLWGALFHTKWSVFRSSLGLPRK